MKKPAYEETQKKHRGGGIPSPLGLTPQPPPSSDHPPAYEETEGGTLRKIIDLIGLIHPAEGNKKLKFRYL